MKKTILLFTVLFAMTCHAQDPLTLIVDKNGVAGYDYNTTLVGMGDEHYVCTDYTMINGMTRVAQDIITCVSKSGTSGRKIVVERSMDYNLIAFYEGEDRINCLYTFYDYPAKSYALFLNSVPKEATKGEWKPEKIISFKLERREDILVGHSVSPDQTKAAVVIFQVNKAGLFQADKSDKLKGSAVLAFGDEGLLWANPLEMELANTTLNILDIAVNNNANVYVAISSFNKPNPSKSQKENEMLHLIEVGAEETRSAEIQPDFGYLNNGKLFLCASGDVAVGGYYQATADQKASGAYLATFDGKQMDNGRFSVQPFPQDYYDYKHPKFSKKGEDFEAVPVEIKEFGNGTKVLLGEPRTSVSVPNYTFTLFGNILVSFADKDGNLNNFQMIRKDQLITNHSNKSTKFYQSDLLCFNTILHNDRLYIFYNDNLANHTGKTGQALSITTTNYKKKCAMYCTIGSDGRISEPSMLMNYEKYKSVIYRPLVIDEDGLLIYNSNKVLYGAVSKLGHEF